MKTEKPIYELGQLIETELFYERRKGKTNWWQKVRFKSSRFVTIVGVRTLSNGTTDYDPEVGHTYVSSSHFKALLVAEHINTKTFYIPIPE